MLDGEKAGFVRSFLIELALTVRALYPDANLQYEDQAFMNSAVETDEDGIVRAFIDSPLVIKRNANYSELDSIHDSITQTINCLYVKHHLVEKMVTYEHGTLVEFYSDGSVTGVGEFCLAPYFTVRFKEI